MNEAQFSGCNIGSTLPYHIIMVQRLTQNTSGSTLRWRFCIWFLLMWLNFTLLQGPIIVVCYNGPASFSQWVTSPAFENTGIWNSFSLQCCAPGPCVSRHMHKPAQCSNKIYLLELFYTCPITYAYIVSSSLILSRMRQENDKNLV